MAKKSKSPLVQQAKETAIREGYRMTNEEAEQYGRIIDCIIQARDEREKSREEFDHLSYEQTYLSNKRAAISYLVPKRNDDEVRINTGTTEKRIELTLNELLSLNLDGEVKTFDKDDNLLQDVSDIFTDLVQRTEQIEKSRDKDIFIYQELLTQPSVFVEELWIKERVEPTLKSFRTRNRCERRLVQGPQMYLGDIYLPDTRWNEQPFLIKYARLNMDEAKFLFEELNPKKWKHVKPGKYTTVGSPHEKIYRKASLESDEVEAFWYMSWPDNEVQIIVQGIPFLPLGTKYTEVFGNLGGYHITMVSLKPYGGDFAYGKPLTQSAKTLQALDNETIRNLIRKFRQALEPPTAIIGPRTFTRDIWNAGTIVHGIRKSDFERLIDHQGVTNSELAMFDLVEKKINEFLGSSQQDPLEGKTQVTATELNLAQRQAIKMLGMAVLAVMRLKDRLVMLRVRNILANYTKPIGTEFDPIQNGVKEIYARFTIEGADVGGRTGQRIIQFMDRDLTAGEKDFVFGEEQKAARQGKDFEFKGVNAKKLRDLELYFYPVVSAKERESTQVDKAMMTEMLNQAQAVSAITGRPINANKIIEKFERVYKERDLFEKDIGQLEQELGTEPEGRGTEARIGQRPRTGLSPQPMSAADIV